MESINVYGQKERGQARLPDLETHEVERLFSHRGRSSGDHSVYSDTIRWMNVTRYLQKRKDKTSRQILFAGEKLDMEAVWKVRDQFFPPKTLTRK